MFWIAVTHQTYSFVPAIHESLMYLICHCRQYIYIIYWDYLCRHMYHVKRRDTKKCGIFYNQLLHVMWCIYTYMIWDITWSRIPYNTQDPRGTCLFSYKDNPRSNTGIKAMKPHNIHISYMYVYELVLNIHTRQCFIWKICWAKITKCGYQIT